MAGGGGGSRDAGLAVIQQTLEGWGVPMAGVALGGRIGAEQRQPPHLRRAARRARPPRTRRCVRDRVADRRPERDVVGPVRRFSGRWSAAGEDGHARQRAARRRPPRRQVPVRVPAGRRQRDDRVRAGPQLRRTRSPTKPSTSRSGTPSPPRSPPTPKARPPPSSAPADGRKPVLNPGQARFRDQIFQRTAGGTVTGHGGAADVPARHRPAARWDPAAARVRAALPPARDRLPRRRRRRPRVRRDHDRARLGGRRRRHPHATSVSLRGWFRSRRLPDGRYAVVAVGTRRIRILAWLPDDPYPLADVDDWPDEEPDVDGLAARVEATREAARRRARAGGADGRPARGPGTDGQRRPAAGLLPPRRTGADRPRRPLPAAQRAGHPPSASTCSPRSLDDVEAMLQFPIGLRAAVIERQA